MLDDKPARLERVSCPTAVKGTGIRRTRIAALVMLCVSSGALLYLIGIYFGVGEHLTALQIGRRMLAFIDITVFLNPVAGRAMQRWDPVVVLTFGLALAGMGCFFQTRLSAHADFRDIAWRLAIIGAGDAFMLSAVSVTAISAVPHHQAGVAATANTALRQLGAAVGPAVLGVIYASRLSSGHTINSAMDFSPDGPGASEPPGVDGAGSEFSLRDLLQRRDLEHLIGDDPL